MRIYGRLAAAAAAGALLLAGPSAFADTVYNDLDGVVDSSLELMSLTYDTGLGTGTSGSTTLSIQIDGHEAANHKGCDLNGTPHFIALEPVVSDPAVASVSLSNGGVLSSCDDSITAMVQALGVGSTTVSFEIVDSDLPASGESPFPFGFRLDEAAFQVNVIEGTTTPPVGCDADPAAPAWSAAIMQKSKIKPGSKDWRSVQSVIAQEMGQGATFDGWAKNQHPQYEDAVQARVQELLPNKNIVSAQDAARPGWECAVLQ